MKTNNSNRNQQPKNYMIFLVGKTGKRRKRVYNELLKNCKQNPSTDVLSASDFVQKADAMIHNESLTKKFLEENVSISIRTDSVDEWSVRVHNK